MSNSNGVDECGNGLETRKEDGTNVVRVGEAKDGFSGGEGYALCDLNREGIYGPGVLRVNDDVCTLWVKSGSNEIQGILLGKELGLFEFEVKLEEEFFIVGELEVVRALELVLHPFGEDELGQVSDVGVSTGTATVIQVEGVAFLVFIEDEVHVSVTEVDSTFQQVMQFPCMFLEPLEDFVIDEFGAKLFHEFGVIYVSFHFPWGYYKVIVT